MPGSYQAWTKLLHLLYALRNQYDARETLALNW